MHHARIWFAFASVVGLGVGLGAACPSKDRAAGGTAGQAGGEVVARIQDQVITVGQVEEQINKLPPFTRTRYSSPEQKKKFLENLVRFEVMALEARNRGYERDPDVQRVLKQQMISEFLQKEVDAKQRPEDVTPAEVEAYYRAHLGDFVRPDEVRVSQIFLKDKAAAEKVAPEAKTAKSAQDFGALVAKHSEDEDSKSRGGDLTFFDRETTLFPKPVVEAAFALKEIGDVSTPIQSEQGFHILKLTQKRPGFTRPLDEVKQDVQRRVLQERRVKTIETMVAEMRKKLKVEVYESELAKVSTEPSK